MIPNFASNSCELVRASDHHTPVVSRKLQGRYPSVALYGFKAPGWSLNLQQSRRLFSVIRVSNLQQPRYSVFVFLKARRIGHLRCRDTQT